MGTSVGTSEGTSVGGSVGTSVGGSKRTKKKECAAAHSFVIFVY